MKNYRLFTAIGTLAALAIWAARAPDLLEMTRIGALSPIVLILFTAAVVSLAVGALRVHFGKSGRASFSLHLIFAGAATLLAGIAPVLPLIFSVLVAIVALAWSYTAQRQASAKAAQ